MQIQNTLKKTAERFSQKPAIVFKDQTITFTQLYANAARLANTLLQAGVKKGDKIGIYLPNSPEYVYSYLATFFVGAVAVPLDFMLKGDELISCLSHSEAKILIAVPKNEIDLADIRQKVPSIQTVMMAFELLTNPKTDFSTEPVAPSEPALIMYTSGTTGKPKGIRLNYKHLDGSPKAMEHFVDLTEADIKLCAIPFSHIAGLIYIQNCITFGITLILMDRFNPLEFLRNIEQYKVSCFHIVPAMYMALLSLKDLSKFDLSSLRWAVVFGAPSSPEALERFHQYCPNAQLLNGWGMTETCPPNTVTPLGSKNIASVGKVSPHCQIKIVDDFGNPLPSGLIGEVIISGEYIMDSYYKDPEATAAIVKDGWLYTGDLGQFDQEGFFYIVGRKKEMIKVGGQIVFAPEVEAAFYKHEAVAEAAVVGVADQLRGEVIKAFVVLKEGAQVSAEDLRYFAREHLANFKVPQTIELRDSLPKNRTGKIDKEILKQGTPV